MREKGSFSRRDFLKGLGSVAIGAVAGSVTEKVSETYREGLPIVKELDKRKKNFENNEALATNIADSETPEGTLPERIYKQFSTPQEQQHMPDTIRQMLADISPGIPAQESIYDKNAVSPSDARGRWQFKKASAEEALRYSTLSKSETAKSIREDDKKETTVAFAHFDRFIYEIFRKHGIPKKLQSHFTLTNTERDELVTLFMVNAYNAGAKTIENIVEWATANITARDILPHRSTMLELFDYIAHSAYTHKVDTNYDTDSRWYTINVVAGSENMHEKYIHGDLHGKKAGATTTAVAAGSLTGVTSVAVLQEQTQLRSQTLRETLKKIGIALVAAPAGAAGTLATRRNPTHTYWWRT